MSETMAIITEVSVSRARGRSVLCAGVVPRVPQHLMVRRRCASNDEEQIGKSIQIAHGFRIRILNTEGVALRPPANTTADMYLCSRDRAAGQHKGPQRRKRRIRLIARFFKPGHVIGSDTGMRLTFHTVCGAARSEPMS